MTTKKQVQFSDASMLYMYNEDPCYARTKSYPSSHKKRFTRESLKEAIRIARLLQECKDVEKSSSSTTKKQSLASQLEACGVSPEEILGLEHLVLEKPTHVRERRRIHSQVVLREHAEQMKKGGRSDVQRLAQLSAVHSKRPVSQAQKRAAMAA